MPMEKIVAALLEAIWTTSTVARAPLMSHVATEVWFRTFSYPLSRMPILPGPQPGRPAGVVVSKQIVTFPLVQFVGGHVIAVAILARPRCALR